MAQAGKNVPSLLALCPIMLYKNGKKQGKQGIFAGPENGKEKAPNSQ